MRKRMSLVGLDMNTIRPGFTITGEPLSTIPR